MRIFLSYGRDKYASLAVRIKRDLQALGHEVWFDLERLKPGGDWERYIEEGFEFASKDSESGRFLLLMTPHSVRRPDPSAANRRSYGYCLNEVARAYSRNLPIIPVMVADVEPPLSICSLQWLDMRQCFPAEQHEERYKKQFGQLLVGLEKLVPFEGVQQRLQSRLNPITYVEDLVRHRLRFTGREWVMNEVEGWLRSSRRVLWITGEAGVGKSAIAAWLCDKRPEIAAYHFCRFGNTERTDARRILFSVAFQLATQVPVFWDRLNASALDEIAVETNVPAIFDQLLANRLSDAVPLTDKPHVLLIDGLDEATSTGKNELASLIAHEFNRLPSWLRVIVTSRPYEKEINFALQALDPWKLDAGREENVRDIREYLDRELGPFTGNGAPSEAVVEQIVKKSEGLFLYVSWVRRELEDGHLSLQDVEKFPQGLGGIYAEFFQRYFPDLYEYETVCRPALEAICAVREPIERSSLASLLERSEYEMRQLMARLGSLFPVVDGRVRPFHHSVRDWLVDPDRSADYWIDVSAQEERLADLAWEEYQAGVNKMGKYCIKYAPSHLANCHRKDELEKVLLDPGWMQAKLQASDVVVLLADYDLALDIVSPKLRGEVGGPTAAPINLPPAMFEATAVDAETSALRLAQGAIRLSAHVIAKDPAQFTSQIVGRLLPHGDIPAIARFVDRVVNGTRIPWLRLLQPTLHPPGTSLVRTLEGHTYPVYGVALTRDGRLAVSASWDLTLKVWDLKGGGELRTLKDHTGWVLAVAMDGDGRRAVSASEDQTLKVWDVESGRKLHTLKGHSAPVRGVAISGDGRIAVSASDDQTLKVWDLENGCELRTLKGHSGDVYGVALSGDGRLAVSASLDQTLKVWNVQTGHELRTLQGHASNVNGVALSRDGRRAVSASDDKTLKVWDVDSGHELRTLQGHASDVNGVALSGDGRRAVSASSDSTLMVWDVDGKRDLRTLQGHSDAVHGLAVGGDGRWAISASADKTLKVWDVESGRELRTLQGHTRGVLGVAVVGDGRRAVSASRDETLKVWDVDSGRELRTLRGHESVVSCIAVSADGRRAVSASVDKTLKTWDVESGRELRTLRGHSSLIHGVALSADGGRVVSASEDRTLKAWDLKSRRELCTLQGHSAPVRGVALTRDGLRAVSASQDQTLKVWDVQAGHELRTLQGHAGWVLGVALSRNERWAVSSSEDKTLRIWDVDSGGLLATFTCDTSAPCCAFINDDKLVTGDAAGHVHFLRLVAPKPKG